MRYQAVILLFVFVQAGCTTLRISCEVPGRYIVICICTGWLYHTTNQLGGTRPLYCYLYLYRLAVPHYESAVRYQAVILLFVFVQAGCTTLRISWEVPGRYIVVCICTGWLYHTTNQAVILLFVFVQAGCTTLRIRPLYCCLYLYRLAVPHYESAGR